MPIDEARANSFAAPPAPLATAPAGAKAAFEAKGELAEAAAADPDNGAGRGTTPATATDGSPEDPAAAAPATAATAGGGAAPTAASAREARVERSTPTLALLTPPPILFLSRTTSCREEPLARALRMALSRLPLPRARPSPTPTSTPPPKTSETVPDEPIRGRSRAGVGTTATAAGPVAVAAAAAADGIAGGIVFLTASLDDIWGHSPPPA